MYTVAFRTDGGPNIGMGHIMRCLALAKEFRKQGHEVYFISKYKEGIDKIKETGFKVILLKHDDTLNSNEVYYGDPCELNNEALHVINQIKKNKIDVLIVDSYNISGSYFLQIKPYVKKLVYIDDINKFCYPVDMLINGDITGEYMCYKKYSEDETLLLGPKYALMRDEFKNLSEAVVKEDVKEIMITTGGSDHYNMSAKITNMILEDEELKELNINIVVGNSFKNIEEIKKISCKSKNVTLHKNVIYMSEIMLKSDIAISAGGNTLYELCACGTPTLAFIMADNQEFFVKKMDELKYIKNLGWYYNLYANTVIDTIKSLIKDYNIRVGYVNKQQNLVDGKGKERIVDIIINQK